MLESWQEAMNLDQDTVTNFLAGILSNDVHARIVSKTQQSWPPCKNLEQDPTILTNLQESCARSLDKFVCQNFEQDPTILTNFHSRILSKINNILTKSLGCVRLQLWTEFDSYRRMCFHIPNLREGRGIASTCYIEAMNICHPKKLPN